VRDLVVGSGTGFEDRGSTELASEPSISTPYRPRPDANPNPRSLGSMEICGCGQSGAMSSRIQVTWSMTTEFVVLPIFGRDGQPEYQIEIHLGGRDGLTLSELDAALGHAQTLLRPGVA
jgi:hypothetical protein